MRSVQIIVRSLNPYFHSLLNVQRAELFKKRLCSSAHKQEVRDCSQAMLTSYLSSAHLRIQQ